MDLAFFLVLSAVVFVAATVAAFTVKILDFFE